jgi:4-diphosphocytidyl-2-C-methyl-D-erythritol kinase
LSGESYKKLLAISKFVNMISFPNCKINLGLNVISKRDDGYHEIASVMYPVDIQDILEVIKSETFEFTRSGLDIPGELSDNLCTKAYKIIERDYKINPVHIHLYKNIPMGAGLGGGSADAAFTLKLINKLYELNISNNQLKKYASELGSDCAFFIENIPQYASGRGEVLEPFNLTLKGKTIILINDGTHISTEEAYGNVTPHPPENNIQEVLSKPLNQWKNLLVNDFEKGVFKNHPQLKEYIEKLYESGAEYAAMTGSGSTVFGVFNESPKLHSDLQDLSGFVKELTLN